MTVLHRSILTAALIAGAIHTFTMGVLRDVLPHEATPPLLHTTRSLHFEEGRALRLVHSDGAVEVFSHTGPDVRVDVEIRAYGPEELLGQTESYVESMITGTVEGDNIRLVTESGERPEPVDIRADYRLTVPEGADVSVEGANGNVMVHDGCGAVYIQGNNTDIHIARPGGAVRAESNNGRIEVEGAPGDTELKTVNGSIRASLSGGYLKAETTNGAVDVLLENAGVTACNLTSLNGGITLLVSDSRGLTLDAETDSGTIRSGLDLSYADGYPRRRKVVGASGSGETRIRLYSRNGDIDIARSPT